MLQKTVEPRQRLLRAIAVNSDVEKVRVLLVPIAKQSCCNTKQHQVNGEHDDMF